MRLLNGSILIVTTMLSFHLYANELATVDVVSVGVIPVSVNGYEGVKWGTQSRSLRQRIRGLELVPKEPKKRPEPTTLTFDFTVERPRRIDYGVLPNEELWEPRTISLRSSSEPASEEMLSCVEGEHLGNVFCIIDVDWSARNGVFILKVDSMESASEGVWSSEVVVPAESGNVHIAGKISLRYTMSGLSSRVRIDQKIRPADDDNEIRYMKRIKVAEYEGTVTYRFVDDRLRYVSVGLDFPEWKNPNASDEQAEFRHGLLSRGRCSEMEKLVETKYGAMRSEPGTELQEDYKSKSSQNAVNRLLFFCSSRGVSITHLDRKWADQKLVNTATGL